MLKSVPRAHEKPSRSSKGSAKAESGPRRSRAQEKREQILQTYIDCVIELGIDKASMGEVGSRLGLDRSSIHYYFRTREELMAAATDLAIRAYVERLHSVAAGFSSNDRGRQLIEHLFSAAFHQPRWSKLMDELSVAGNRNAVIDRMLAGVYASIERMILDQVEAAYPAAPPKRRRQIGYAVAQLCAGCMEYVSLDFPPDRRQAGRAAAQALLELLDADKG